MKKKLMSYKSLSKRWNCSESRLRNAKPEQLPARLNLPGSRLVRFPFEEVLRFEAAHIQARDYDAERKLGATPVFGSSRRTGLRNKGARS